MTIGWAVIDTGRVQRWMAPALKQVRDTRLVAVLSRDKVRAAASFRGRFSWIVFQIFFAPWK